MNYIRHLRSFFNRVEEDANITSHHISLYMALFNLWNVNRFRKRFEVNRLDLMAMARIGSRNTYAKFSSLLLRSTKCTSKVLLDSMSINLI